jgi:hypothetical protein
VNALGDADNLANFSPGFLRAGDTGPIRRNGTLPVSGLMVNMLDLVTDFGSNGNADPLGLIGPTKRLLGVNVLRCRASVTQPGATKVTFAALFWTSPSS